MAELTTKRKKYVRGMTATWWKKTDLYKFYMLREATALPIFWFSIVLLYGVICLGSEQSFTQNFIPFLQNPVVIILNIISFAGLILHAATLFSMTGEVMAGQIGVNAKVIRNALRGLCTAISILALILVFI